MAQANHAHDSKTQELRISLQPLILRLCRFFTDFKLGALPIIVLMLALRGEMSL